MTDTQRNQASLQRLFDEVMNGQNLDAAVSGTHRGNFMGIPATGNSFTVDNAGYCRFTQDHLICEHWGLVDIASMMRQLGVTP
jgi:predicted ester cyclase